MKNWLVICGGSAVAVAVLWCTSLPLGIPGEWTWERPPYESDLFWNFIGGAVAATLYSAYVLRVGKRFSELRNRPLDWLESAWWLLGLIAIGFAWLWIVQEVSPARNRLGKSAFVLYFPSSSGYFTRARYIEPSPKSLLEGYEDLMHEGDVLHTGTHPPGLFLVFHGLIDLCERSERISSFLDATQSPSFREACDIISTNNLRRETVKPLLPLDRRVLWLATLLVMLSASLTVVPIYGLLRRNVSVHTAWVCSAMWPAIPAVAIFVPKSDVVFPLLGTMFLWLWLTAWDRRSVTLALLAGAVAWCSLMCSLAFLPVFLAAAILAIGSTWFFVAPINDGIPTVRRRYSQLKMDIRRWLCIVAASIGFAVPTYTLWRDFHINMLNIWLLNFRNHAGFYVQYPRTYWKWLMLNPVELAYAAGWPIAVIALFTCIKGLKEFRGESTRQTTTVLFNVVVSITGVWGLLWITGKNSGEAARLWILFMPWLIWLVSFEIDSVLRLASDNKIRDRNVIAILAIQLAVCLLTVARVSGFNVESNS